MKVKDRLFMSYGKVDIENEKSSFLSSPKRNLKKKSVIHKNRTSVPVSPQKVNAVHLFLLNKALTYNKLAF